MRAYEVAYIVVPELDDEGIAAIRDRFAELAKAEGAQVGNITIWRKRRLVYEIKDKREGHYIIMQLSAEPAAMAELERQLKLTESVLRHLVVRLKEREVLPRAEVAQAEAAREAPVEEPTEQPEAPEEAAAEAAEAQAPPESEGEG